MCKLFYKIAFLCLLVIGLWSTLALSGNYASIAKLQLSEDEHQERRIRARGITHFRQLRPYSDYTSYSEWLATRGAPESFSTQLVIKSTPLRSESKFCVLVDSAIFRRIENSLNQYTSDLVADNFSVEVYKVSGGTPEELRNFLKSLHKVGMEGCLFVGDLPVAWFECLPCWDGDPDNIPIDEEFPIDLYYMDLDGKFLDTDENGLFEVHESDVSPEIYVGRLTASNLTFGDDEANLLRNYFRKNHLYRTGQLNLNTRALLFIDDDWTHCDLWDDCADNWQIYMQYAYCNSILIKDLNTTNRIEYQKQLTENYECLMVAAHSDWTSHHFSAVNPALGGAVFNWQIPLIDPAAIFYNLFACSNARYIEQDYMGGWYIFSDSYGLAAIGSAKIGSMLSFDLFYYPFGNGATYGQSFLAWFQEILKYGATNFEISWFYGMTLLGDPTLRASERRPVEITTSELPMGRVGMAYTAAFDADGGGAPPYLWNIISGALPPGLQINSSTGAIWGIPGEPGMFNLTVTADDQCLPIYADTNDLRFDIISKCGDANGDGTINMADVEDIIDYLYNDGHALNPVVGAEADGYIGVSNHDAQFLYNYVSGFRAIPYCPPFTKTIPSRPENILEVRNRNVPPGMSKIRLEFWLDTDEPVYGLCVPFEYSCQTSTIICDSISFFDSDFNQYMHLYTAIDIQAGKAVIGIVNTGESPPSYNPCKVASIWFSLTPSEEELVIVIDTSAYAPNDYIVISPANNSPYAPRIVNVADISSQCGDVTYDGPINILDIVYLINFLYKDGPEPIVPNSADVNSDGNINILDIVYLINYVYKGGIEPDCQ